MEFTYKSEIYYGLPDGTKWYTWRPALQERELPFPSKTLDREWAIVQLQEDAKVIDDLPYMER